MFRAVKLRKMLMEFGRQRDKRSLNSNFRACIFRAVGFCFKDNGLNFTFIISLCLHYIFIYLHLFCSCFPCYYISLETGNGLMGIPCKSHVLGFPNGEHDAKDLSGFVSPSTCKSTYYSVEMKRFHCRGSLF